jgi:heparin/heparan-sulfate lyase
MKNLNIFYVYHEFLKEEKSMKRITILVLLLIFCLGTVSFPLTTNNNYYLETTEIIKPLEKHPRLLINKDNISNIRETFEDSDVRVIKNTIDNDLYSYFFSQDSESLRKSFEANAFYYLLYKDRYKGKMAIRLALSSLKNYESNPSSFKNPGRLALGGAFVYDWCYDLMSSKDRTKMIGYLKNILSDSEIGYPVNIRSYITGHSSGTLLLRDMLAVGIAIYDEDSEVYNMAAKEFLNEYVPARNFAYDAGMHYQGSNYGTARFESEIFSAWLFHNIGYDNIFKNQESVAYNTIYSKRPDDKFMQEGDIFDMKYFSQYAMIMTAGLYKDRYIANIDDNIYRYRDEPLFYTLTYSPDIEPKSFESLPLSRYFSSPQGMMVSRTSWDEGIASNTAIAQFKIGEYNFANHSHLDAGSFQFYYKGALATESGVYEGNTGGYGSSHDINYNKRSIAHNILVVEDPNETFIYQNQQVSNDGGQRIPNYGSEAKDLESILKEGYEVGDIEAQYIGEDLSKPVFTYLKGDLTKAYSSKIKSYKRYFTFINLFEDDIPAALVVFDKVESSNKDFVKKFLLHSIYEPSISNNKITIKNNQNGYNGKLTNDILYPLSSNLNLNIVGGNGMEYFVDGVNYPNTSNNSSVEAASYRVEISPDSSNEKDMFLNVMQVTDYNSSKYYTVEKLENYKLIGAKIKDKIVLYSKKIELNDKLNEDISIPYNSGQYVIEYMITDLQNGIWEVYENGKYKKDVLINYNNPVAVFKASGSVNLKMK